MLEESLLNRFTKKHTVISITDFRMGISKLDLKDIFSYSTREKNIRIMGLVYPL